MRKIVLLRMVCFCLLLLVVSRVCARIKVIPVFGTTTHTTPYTPINYNVLIIASGSSVFAGSGLTASDFARYGFNMTYSDADTIDFTTDSKTSDLSQYDVIFVQGIYTGASPVKISVTEIEHFVNYDGILILNSISFLKNETDASWWGLSSATVQKIEGRMGIDYTNYGSQKNATFQKTNSSIAGAPSSFNGTFESGFYYTPTVTLNGASEVYNVTLRGESAKVGITFYKNATGAIGIYIGYPYSLDNNGQMLGISPDDSEQRAEMLHALIAYAKQQTFNTIISPQNMAMWRYDDPTSVPPYDDTVFLNALNYLYNACVTNPFDPDRTNYGIIPNVAYVEGTGSSYPNTLARLQELEAEGKIAIESHFGHEDYRAWTVAQINAQWDIDVAEWQNLGFNQFSYLMVPVGGDYSYETANMLSTMSSRGVYIMDLAFNTGWDWHVNGSIIVRGVLNIGNEQNFTQKSQATIESTYRYFRKWLVLAIANGGVNFYQHPTPFEFNECGPYWIYTVASNFTEQVGDIEWLAGYEWGLYAPSYKWAVVSNPSQIGSTINSSLNVENVSSIVTIGKGMAWLRIDNTDTIASVKVDGSNWCVFDANTIRIPASNSNMEITLGTPTTPYIKDSDRKITTTSYSTDKLTFTVYSLAGTRSISKVYVGDEGEPREVYVSSGNFSWSYDAPSKILEVRVSHLGRAEIIVD